MYRWSWICWKMRSWKILGLNGLYSSLNSWSFCDVLCSEDASRPWYPVLAMVLLCRRDIKDWFPPLVVCFPRKQFAVTSKVLLLLLGNRPAYSSEAYFQWDSRRALNWSKTTMPNCSGYFFFYRNAWDPLLQKQYCVREASSVCSVFLVSLCEADVIGNFWDQMSLKNIDAQTFACDQLFGHGEFAFVWMLVNRYDPDYSVGGLVLNVATIYS